MSQVKRERAHAERRAERRADDAARARRRERAANARPPSHYPGYGYKDSAAAAAAAAARTRNRAAYRFLAPPDPAFDYYALDERPVGAAGKKHSSYDVDYDPVRYSDDDDERDPWEALASPGDYDDDHDRDDGDGGAIDFDGDGRVRCVLYTGSHTTAFAW